MADGVALAQQCDVERPVVQRLQHAGQMPGTRRHGGGFRPLGRSGAAGDDGGDPAADGLLHDLRADQVHVTVDGTGGDDATVAGDDLRGRPDHQIGVHPGHDVGIAGLADRHDAAVTNADVSLDDSPVVDDHHAGDHGVGSAVGTGGAPLAHRLAQHLAAAEHRLVTGQSRSPLRSSVISTSRSVSASRIRSPVVGPNSAA